MKKKEQKEKQVNVDYEIEQKETATNDSWHTQKPVQN